MEDNEVNDDVFVSVMDMEPLMYDILMWGLDENDFDIQAGGLDPDELLQP